jgi:hypothetical protein
VTLLLNVEDRLPIDRLVEVTVDDRSTRTSPVTRLTVSVGQLVQASASALVGW